MHPAAAEVPWASTVGSPGETKLQAPFAQQIWQTLLLETHDGTPAGAISASPTREISASPSNGPSLSESWLSPSSLSTKRRQSHTSPEGPWLQAHQHCPASSRHQQILSISTRKAARSLALQDNIQLRPSTLQQQETPAAALPTNQIKRGCRFSFPCEHAASRQHKAAIQPGAR